MKYLKSFNESFDSSIDNLVDILLLQKSRKQKQLAFYLLKSSPELIEPVAKKLLSKFEIERKYNTIDELVNDKSLNVAKDMWDEDFKSFSVEFFNFELNNILIACSFSIILSDIEDSMLANRYSNKISPTLLITIDPKRFLYVAKDIKTNSKKLLDDIYDLMEKSWNPILKSKRFLDEVVLDIKDAINELE